LLGGEPSLHPDFKWLVERTLKQGFRLLVFTNGLMSEEALRCLECKSQQQVSVLVNVHSPQEQSRYEAESLGNTLRRLGQRIVLGFNIHSATPRMDFLLDVIDQHRLSRAVRLGLSHPLSDGSNRSLHPKEYMRAGQAVARFVENASERGVTVEYDCGFVPCMFPEGFESRTGSDVGDLGRRCGPIPDILPDGSVVPCYPLSSTWKLTLSDGVDATQMQRQFDSGMQPYRRLGVFRECSTCSWMLTGRCSGGCLAAAMRRLRAVPFAFRFPADGKDRPQRARPAADVGYRQPEDLEETEPAITRESTNRWIVPYVDQPLSFWERLHAEFAPYIREVYMPLPGDVVGSGRPSQPAEHAIAFLKSARFRCSVLINPITLPRPVDEIVPSVVESLSCLQEDFGIAGATVANLLLAVRIREKLPSLPLTASVLMDVASPQQATMLAGVCDTLVPASRIMRDLPALQALREAFAGCIRLLVNEGCIPGCPFRVQHFHEMGGGSPCPQSLCEEVLRKHPWMRLAGSWVLPQHLHLYEGIYDELKLAGRVTLQDPASYRRVLGAYILSHALAPNEIGGGPASPTETLNIDEKFFSRTLYCGHRCH
jgi:radical SAM protein with 4Fe4S-binding SPASM domain